MPRNRRQRRRDSIGGEHSRSLGVFSPRAFTLNGQPAPQHPETPL
jgi:hypothetical protein